jgi:carboxypeptidase C (cathepsin A)
MLDFSTTIAFAASLVLSAAQSAPEATHEPRAAPTLVTGPANSTEAIPIPTDASISGNDSVEIKGVRVPYQYTVGTLPVFGTDNKPIASVFYTYYRRTDVDDVSTRPLVFSFNGGPGSASVWMHVAYTGPRLLRIDEEGFPVQPYGIEDNPHSILDVADIVYVDPVNTGFSRPVAGQDAAQFFGVDNDIAYLARWIGTFVVRNGRWTSPKYLIGESYGTTRCAGLAAALQSSQWMYLNGVILVSPTELGVRRDGIVDAALALPYYAATAWFHKKLPADLQAKELEEMLPEVERFTLDELLPAMARGGSLEPERRAALVARYARYSGLDEVVVRNYNFAVPTSFFWKELLRDEGFTVGRLDSRYRGLDAQDAGTSPDFDPSLTSWNHAFAPAINHYLRDVLGWKTDLQYWIFGPVSGWSFDQDRTGQALRRAMAENPFLHVLVQSGYFDGATDYFNAKYTMWTMDPSGRFQDRMRWRGYRSGHMMYLREPDLATSNQDIRDFIRDSMPKPGAPARR